MSTTHTTQTRGPLRIFVVELMTLDQAPQPILITGDQEEAAAVTRAYNDCRMLDEPGPVAVLRKGVGFVQHSSIGSEVIA